MFSGRASGKGDRAVTQLEINIQLCFYPERRLPCRVIYKVQKNKVNPDHCHHSDFQRNEVCTWLWVCKQLSHMAGAVVYSDGQRCS